MNCKAFLILTLVAVAFAQETEVPEPTTEAPTTTANPGAPFGALCNGLLRQCNRYSNTVACLQRRPEPTSTTTEEAPITTEDPLIALFKGKSVANEPTEICETGLTVDLGRCQCSRNCKQGIYVDDGEFDEEREICVGLVGSACSLLVPNCTKNGRCNLLTSACVCDIGYVANEERRCQPRQ